MTEHSSATFDVPVSGDSGAVSLAAVPVIVAYRDARTAFERAYWTQVLIASRGVVSRAAELADKTRKEVYDAAKRLDLDIGSFRSPKGAS